MKTAVMDRIMRQKNPELKAAVEASIEGEIGKAFEKLGANVAQVNPDNIAGAVAARWLKLSPEERERTGVMTPSHRLRRAVNEHIRERLVREGRIAGPELRTQRLVSKGYTRAEKALASNYEAGDVVAFHRPYKRLGVEKGDERRVERVDYARTGRCISKASEGKTVAWKPSEIGGRQGGTEVYRAETIELRAGRPHPLDPQRQGAGCREQRHGRGAGRAQRTGDVRCWRKASKITLTPGDPQLRHLDRAWCSTVHAFQGQHGEQRDRGDGGERTLT